MAWPPVPAMRSRAEHFDALVLDCADRVRPHLGTRYAALEFAVEEVPPALNFAPLENAIAALTRAADVVYRRPIEARAHDDADLAEIVREVVTEQVAALLGVPPHEIDPDRDPDA